MKLVSVALMAIAVQSGAGSGVLPAGDITYRPVILVQLAVSDLDRAIRFYTETLGFRISERRDDLKFAHIATPVEGLQIGLSAGGTVSGSGAAVINIGVTDANAARAALEAKGVKFPRPTTVIPGKVTLAEFQDPDGNRLRFAGPATGETPKKH
jgi:predicted enzyme related to lactoylglutathione lyase